MLYPVGKKLVRRSHFAQSKGVAAGSITKACRPGGQLRPACVGKLIDAAHPAAVAYTPTAPLAGHGADDPLYNDAIAACFESGRWSRLYVCGRFAIGQPRAEKMLNAMRAAGIIPGEVTPPPAPMPVTPPAAPVPTPLEIDRRPVPHVRGHRAANRKAAPFHTPPAPDAESGIADAFDADIPDDLRVFLKWTLGDLIEKFGTDVRFGDWLKATKDIEDINAKRLKNAETRGELVARQLVKVGVIDQINGAHTKLLTDGAKTITRRAVAMAGADRSLEEIEAFVIDQLSSFIRPMKAKISRALRDHVDP